MSMKSLETQILAPGYGIILVGSIVENGIVRTSSFLVGSLIGLVWLIAGVLVLMRASKDLKKGNRFLWSSLVFFRDAQSGFGGAFFCHHAWAVSAF